MTLSIIDIKAADIDMDIVTEPIVIDVVSNDDIEIDVLQE